MVRKIIHIDENKCNGCGLCATACHEGAIEIVNGKAKLVRDDFCDGFGDCLPSCPTGAITFEEREAAAYNEEAVKKAQNEKARKRDEFHTHHSTGGGCPGSKIMQFQASETNALAEKSALSVAQAYSVSQLRQWPCQIKLVPIQAPFFDGAKLLIAADCVAYAYADFHNDFMKGKITLIGCPKLDEGDYTEKLTAIIANNNIKSVTVIRMEVPCCGGLQHAVENAIRNSGKFLPWQIVTISRDGKILE